LDAESGYRPLVASGEKSAHAVAFLRGERVVTVVPRLVIKLGGDWGDTTLELPNGRWQNVLGGDAFAGGDLRLVELFKRFPVALLCRD
jgi:(1->4)-alpha-D-glucan 1-alpha-D-glucosylmutase